jgi:hypothetical protein
MTLQEFKDYIDEWYTQLLDDNFDDYGELLNEEHPNPEMIQAEVDMLEHIINKLKQVGNNNE